MKCTNCSKIDMATIPYIEHEKRMFKAYQREKKLFFSLIVTNVIWVIAIISLLVR